MANLYDDPPFKFYRIPFGTVPPEDYVEKYYTKEFTVPDNKYITNDIIEFKLIEIYAKIIKDKPNNNYTFFIGSGWTAESCVLNYALWMAGCWCDDNFFEEIIR